MRAMSTSTMYPLVRPGLTLLVLSLLAAIPAELSAQASRAEVEAPDRIYPGDLIKLDVWREEDLSGEFQVDRNRIVVLPLVGCVFSLVISPRKRPSIRTVSSKDSFPSKSDPRSMKAVRPPDVPVETDPVAFLPF